MDWRERIETDPGICGGRPRIKGTRLTVEFVLGLKAGGWSEASILENYPQITDDDLRAVFAFVQSLIEQESFMLAPRAA